MGAGARVSDDTSPHDLACDLARALTGRSPVLGVEATHQDRVVILHFPDGLRLAFEVVPRGALRTRRRGV